MSGKKYYLTPDEFSVICGGFGIPMVYGLKQIDGMVDNKEICIALHNMYVNELIKNKDSKGFVADDEITEAMRLIKAAEHFILIDISTRDKLHTICCYVGQKCAVLSEDCLYPDKIILYFADWEEIAEDMLKLSEGIIFSVALVSTATGQNLNKIVIERGDSEANRKEILDNYYKEALNI